MAGVETRVGTSVPTSVGVEGLGHGGRRAGTGRAAELASEAARAEGASSPYHRPWPTAGGVAVVPVKRDRGMRPNSPAGWCRLRRPSDPAADEPGRPIALDSGAAVPQRGSGAAAAPPLPGRAWWPVRRGEGPPPGPPPAECRCVGERSTGSPGWRAVRMALEDAGRAARPLDGVQPMALRAGNRPGRPHGLTA